VDETGDRDGLPNVVLEAMSCGRPIVASDVGAIGDAVIPGETGLLVPPGDSAALAAALDDLSRQPDHRANFGRNARHRIESRWTLPTCTDRLCDFLEATYA
jgi:glycosyltransferase involved in cell wall biosynthesis